jgi:hypothetical protein
VTNWVMSKVTAWFMGAPLSGDDVLS